MRQGVLDRITIDHVMASAAIPLIFPAAMVNGEYYGDGAMRQGAPLAPAVHLGAKKILAVSVRFIPPDERRRMPGYPPPAKIIGLLFNSLFLDSIDGDTERLERINRMISMYPSDAPLPEELKPLRLYVLRPSRDIGGIASQYISKLPPALKLLSRGLGAHRLRNADFVSYLLFTEEFPSRLIDLGYDDAAREGARLKEFLDAS